MSLTRCARIKFICLGRGRDGGNVAREQTRGINDSETFLAPPSMSTRTIRIRDDGGRSGVSK